MGVRFYDKENMSNGDNSTTTTRTNCNCNTCNQLPSSATTCTNETKTTSNLYNGNKTTFQKSGILREITGNCKEVRIEENIHNLRIVGNNNRIHITLNIGDIIIIGNNTRLKIKINHGFIKYTGNDGRINLGKESTEQLVDYSGCNGVLKVQNSKKSSQVNDADNNDEGNSTTGITSCFSEKSSNSNKKIKYASFSGLPSTCHNIFNRKRSMPNIKTKSFQSESAFSNHTHPLPQSIVPNFGNIVIANSSNICISPYTTIFK